MNKLRVVLFFFQFIFVLGNIYFIILSSELMIHTLQQKIILL